MDKVIGFLESLATKLGTTVEALWPHAVRHIALEGLFAVLAGVVLLVVSISFYLYFRKEPWFHKWTDGNGTKQAFLGPRGWALIAIGVFTVAFTIESCSKLPQVFEPQGHLVRKILRQIR